MKTTTPQTLTANDTQVVALTNRARAKAGLKMLRPDPKLMAAAKEHADDMAEHDFFDHVSRDGSTFVDRARRLGYKDVSGENIAWGQSSPSEVVKTWLASPGHRKNILERSARAVGVAVARRRSDGALMWVQEFGRV